MFRKYLIVSTICGLTVGCVSVPEPDMNRISTALNQRMMQNTAFVDPDDHESREYLLYSLLEHPLTPASVIQVALLGDAVHAELANLGIGEANLVEAVQISNPALSLGAMRPEGGGRWQLDFGISQSLLEVLTRSQRRRLAIADHESLQLEVLERLTRHLQSVQQSYYEAVYFRHRAVILALIEDIARTEAELASRLYRAGNISELDYLAVTSRADNSELTSRQAATAAMQKRWQLATLLGLADIEAFDIPQQLPDIPDETFDIGLLADEARENRLDVVILQGSLERYQHQLSLYRKTGRLDHIELALKAERGSNGHRSYGPEISFALPVFHQGQASIAMFNASMKQLEYRLRTLELRINSEISQAVLVMESSRQQRNMLMNNTIPQYERIVDLSLQRYNFMLSGVDQALQTRQQEYLAYLIHAETLFAYWQARSDLAMARGANIPLPAVWPAPFPGNHALLPDDHAEHESDSRPSIEHHSHGDHP